MDAMNRYRMFNLSERRVLKSLIQRIFPDINIDELISMEYESRMSSGVSNGGVINSDMMNDQRDVRTTLAPFLKFFISTIPYYKDIKLSHGTLIVTHASQKGFVSFQTIHRVCVEAGEGMHEISDTPNIKRFIENLKEIAERSRGEKRRAALSLLLEIGDLDVIDRKDGVKNPVMLEERLKKTIPTGYYGFYTRKGIFGDKGAAVENKGRIIVETLLAPMVNVYRSSVERSLLHVDETKDYKRIVVDHASNVSQVKGKIRSGVQMRLYDEEGYVTSDALNRYSKIVGYTKEGSIGVYVNGTLVPVLIVDPSSKSISVASTKEAPALMYQIIRALGIDIKEQTFREVLEDNRKGELNVEKNLWAMAAGVFVNANTSPMISDVILKIGEKSSSMILTDEQKRAVDLEIRDALLANQEEYTRSPMSHYKNGSDGISILKSMLREVYSEHGSKFQSAERSMSFGEETSDLESYLEGNETLKSVYPVSYASPNVMDSFMLVNELSKREMEIIDADYVSTTRDILENNVQTVVLGSEITEMLSSGGKRLMSVINAIGSRFSKSILFDGTQAASIFSGVKNTVFKGSSPVLSIVRSSDFDGWLGKTSAMDYNKAPKSRVFHAMVNLGFINELMTSKNDTFYMVLDPHADKKNTRVVQVQQGAGDQRLFQVVKRKELVNGSEVDITSVEINKKALINAIHSNVIYAKNAQRDSLSKWVEVINKFKKGAIEEGATADKVRKVIATFEANEFKRFVEHSNLTATYDYKITKEGVNLGNAASLSSAHSIYDDEFCTKFTEAASGRDVSPDALYSLIKKQFFPSYRDFAETLQDYGYKAPNAYFNALSSEARKKKVAAVNQAKDQVSKEVAEKIRRKIEKFEKEEQARLAEDPTYQTISDYLKMNLQDFTHISDIQGLTHENGVTNELGFRVKEESVRILKSIDKGNMYEKVFSKLFDGYSSREMSNYFNTESYEQWNPVFESFFFAYHIVNNDLAKISKGSTFYTKDIVDFVKRSAGEAAPGTKLDTTIKTGLPSRIRHLVVRFGDGSHPWSLDSNGKPKKHSNLISDGQGVLNPLMGVLMQNSAGPEYGPVGNSMVKNVCHYHDFEQNSTFYLKQALRRITGTTIRMSEEDFNLMRVMNRAIWDMPFLGGLTYGQAFENFRKGDDTYSFDTILNHAVNTVNTTPSLKDRIVFQAIDPSAVKTGATKIHDLKEVLSQKEAFTDEELMVTDASRMRIQLNVEKDIYSSRKNLPIQILNLIGIIKGNEKIYSSVHSSIAQIIDTFTSSFIKGKDGSAKSPTQFVRDLLKRMSGGDTQHHVSNAINDTSISLSSIRSKGVSTLISYVNDFVKPTMSGNTYAQGTCRIDVHRDKNGVASVGLDANSKFNDKHKPSTLKPMRFHFDGVELEPKDGMTVEDQVKDILQDKSRAKLLTVEPAEVVMPYPYMEQFDLKPEWSLERCRQEIKSRGDEKQMKDFEKSLDIFFLRIPTSNASAGSIARIVGFIQDSGNTILIPHEKNAIDGADQDIDMLHVFFRTQDVQAKKERDAETPEFLAKSERVSLQNTIFNGIYDYYSNPNNFEMTFRENDMQSLRDAADEADREDFPVGEEGNDLPSRDRSKANMPASSQRQHEINQDGKAVGFFANMGAFFGKMISISNVAQRELFNPHFDLLRKDSSAMAKTIDFISKLINAATDNAKENILGRINLNNRTASTVSGMLMLGYTEDQVVKVLRSQEMRKASSDVRMTEDLDKYSKKMYEVLAAMDSLSGKTDEEIVKAFNEEFEGKASSIYDVMRYSIEDAIANRDSKVMGAYFVHSLQRIAMIGDAITRFGMMTDITKELPTAPEELRAKLYSIESILGMTAKEFLDNQSRTVADQIQFNVDRMKTDRGYIGNQKETSYAVYETFMRNPENTMDVHALARAYPNFMSTLKLLEGLVNESMPEMFFVDKAYSDGLVDRIAKSTGIGMVHGVDRIKLVDGALNSYAIGKFFSEMDKDRAAIRLGGVVFDLRQPSDRIRFAYAYTNLIRTMKDSDDPMRRDNTFITLASIDKSIDDAFPVVKMNIPYNTDASVTISVQRQIEDLGKNLGPKYDFVRATEMYNMLVYGHGGSKGSLSNVVGTGTQQEFSAWVDKKENIFEDFDDVLQTVVFLAPQATTMNKTNTSTGFTHRKQTRNGRSKGRSRRYEINLFSGATSVDSKYSSVVNTFGASEQFLVPLSNAVSLPLLDMIKLIASPTNSVTVSNGWYKTTPNRPDAQSQNINGLYPVSFQAYIPTGESVIVTAKADAKGRYRDFEVSLSDDQTKAIKDFLSENEAKDDEYNCKF